MMQKKINDEKTEAMSDDVVDPVMAQLKDMYDSVVEEPLPQDLLALLDKLDQAERSR